MDEVAGGGDKLSKNRLKPRQYLIERQIHDLTAPRLADTSSHPPSISPPRIRPNVMCTTAVTTPLDSPPSSDVEVAAQLPPSPPLSPKKPTNPTTTTVSRLLRTLRQRHCGVPNDSKSDWQAFRLTTEEHAELESQLRQEPAAWRWYEEKARWDWEAAGAREGAKEGRGRYTLRMPAALHECFIARVEDGIAREIHGLAGKLREGGDVEGAKEVEKVYKGRSTTLTLAVPQMVEGSSQASTQSTGKEAEGKEVRRSPDATFYHPAQPGLPCVVVEVSYSQQRKDLPRLAESYIVDSSHAIRCVVGLDITYPKTKGATREATLSVWRPGVEPQSDGSDPVGICTCTVSDQPIRDAEGKACTGSLDLGVSDLLPESVISALPSTSRDHSISITCEELNTYLQLAEVEAEEAVPSKQASSTAPKRFRKRKRTPSEELSDGREAEFVAREEKERARDGQVDGEWIAKAGIVKKEDGDEEVVVRRKSRRVEARGNG